MSGYVALYNDKVHSDVVIIISEGMSPANPLLTPFTTPSQPLPNPFLSPSFADLKKLLVLMNYAYIDNNFLVSFRRDCHPLAPIAK